MHVRAHGPESGGQGLKADSLRWWHLVPVGLAFQSLALVVYLNVGFIEQTAGPVAPVVFLLVTLISIPTAISFAVMSNRRPSAGTAFTWLWETTVPPVGLWLGWLMTSAYAMASILQPVMFGLFFNALLRFLGIPTSLATAVLGGLLVTALVAWTTSTRRRRRAASTASSSRCCSACSRSAGSTSPPRSPRRRARPDGSSRW